MTSESANDFKISSTCLIHLVQIAEEDDEIAQFMREVIYLLLVIIRSSNGLKKVGTFASRNQVSVHWKVTAWYKNDFGQSCGVVFICRYLECPFNKVKYFASLNVLIKSSTFAKSYVSFTVMDLRFFRCCRLGNV